MMYDVKERAKELKQIVPMLEELIDADQVDSVVILIKRKDGDFMGGQFLGDRVNLYEWLGMLDCQKDLMKDVVGMMLEGQE